MSITLRVILDIYYRAVFLGPVGRGFVVTWEFRKKKDIKDGLNLFSAKSLEFLNIKRFLLMINTCKKKNTLLGK